MPNFGLEVPVLERLRERLNDAQFVVSYNGKSFDWPLLKSRFVMNRLVPPRELPHLDLLHCARRILKARLGAVNLGRVEREALGFTRVDDVDGADIPELYFDFLETGDVTMMQAVLKHNEWDLLAMPALMIALDEVYRGGGPVQTLDWAGALRVAQRAGARLRATELAHQIVDRPGAARATVDACLHLASEARAQKAYGTEEYWLMKAFDEAGSKDQHRAAYRLTILHEHRTHRYEEALHFAHLSSGSESSQDQRKRVSASQAN